VLAAADEIAVQEFPEVSQRSQEYVYERPLRAGDRITCQSRIADVEDKETRLGTATFVIVETEGRGEDGALAFTARATVILR
jgi:hydroxyacyl-ACP dehydratase HTD2-like protein with hotdog domain